MYQADLKAIALGTGRGMAPGRATGRWSSTTSCYYRIDGHSGSMPILRNSRAHCLQAVAVKLTHACQEQGSTQLIDADKLEPTNSASPFPLSISTTAVDLHLISLHRRSFIFILQLTP